MKYGLRAEGWWWVIGSEAFCSGFLGNFDSSRGAVVIPYIEPRQPRMYEEWEIINLYDGRPRISSSGRIHCSPA